MLYFSTLDTEAGVRAKIYLHSNTEVCDSLAPDVSFLLSFSLPLLVSVIYFFWN